MKHKLRNYGAVSTPPECVCVRDSECESIILQPRHRARLDEITYSLYKTEL